MSQVQRLELIDLAFERDDVPLFQGISASLASGEILQITGANGSGKTTLLRILNTTLAPSSGELRWRGQPLSRNLAEYRANMLFIGHQPGVKLALTPTENLRWLARLWHTNGTAVADALLDSGLAGYEHSPGYTLSAGQLRRVALARLHLSRASLWILDEPFTAIDKTGVKQLEKLLMRHIEAGGMVILTTHQDSGLEQVRKLNLEEMAPAYG